MNYMKIPKNSIPKEIIKLYIEASRYLGVGLIYCKLNEDILSFRTIAGIYYVKQNNIIDMVMFKGNVYTSEDMDVHSSFSKLTTFKGDIKEFTRGGILIDNNNKKYVYSADDNWTELFKYKKH